MAKFDYKQWVTENKYGKINEQNTANSNGLTPSDFTDSACSAIAPGMGVSTISFEGNPNFGQPTPQCDPNFVRTSANENSMWYQNTTPNYLVQDVYNINSQGGFQYWIFNSVNSFASVCCSQSLDDPNAGGMDAGETGQPDPGTQLSASVAALYIQGPVCCDQNAMNYGQNAQGVTPMMPGTYPSPGNFQPGGNATDTYLMTNMGEEYPTMTGEDICNNNICQGDVGGDSFDDTIDPNTQQGMAPSPGGELGDKLAQTMKRKQAPGRAKDGARRSGRPRRLREIKDIIKKAINKLKENQELLLERQYYNSLMAAKYGCNGDCPGQACSQNQMMGGDNDGMFYNVCGAPIQGGGNVAPMNLDRGTPTTRPFKPKRKMRRR